MKTRIARLFAISIGVTLFSAVTYAQKDTISAAAGDKYVISARAGGVNFVEGTVAIVRKNGTSGYLLKGDSLEVGDRVSTGANGKVEILLNPGSFLRLGGNAAFEFKTTSLDDLQLRLDSGSALLEVFAGEDFTVIINAGKSKFMLVESGIYRVDIGQNGTSSLAVWKGQARVANSANTRVKSGREVSVTGDQVAVVKFDRDDKDDLEIWSKTRAKELSKISSRLKGNALRTSLMRSFLGRGWNMYDSFGLWVYDPFGFNYCFLPFGHGWYSPYGYGFGRSIWYYDLPSVIYAPPASRQSGSGTVASGAPTKTRISAAGNREVNTVPPFVRMQQTHGSGRAIVEPVDGTLDTSVRSSAPVFNPAPPTSSSAPTRSDSGGGKVRIRQP